MTDFIQMAWELRVHILLVALVTSIVFMVEGRTDASS